MRDNGTGGVIGSHHAVYAFAPDMGACRAVSSGTRVVFDAMDALGGQVKTEKDLVQGLDFARVNPATGPVAVDGAQPGDTLAVRIRAIDLDDRGVIVTGQGMGWLGDEIEGYATRILPIEGGEVRFGALRLPARPMIGVIGVASERETFATGTAHRHGGNMDTKEIGVGATVYLPVFQHGAQLAMGDVHAAMGDGEICVSGCEIGARITVEVAVLDGGQAKWPLVHAGSELLIVVSLPTVEEALREASRVGVALLSSGLDLPRIDAYMLASLGCDLRISQLVDPNVTAKFVVPEDLMSSMPPIGELLARADGRW